MNTMEKNFEEKELQIMFGQTIRYFRKKKSLTITELSQMVGLHRTYLSSVEKGERNISLINIFKISDALDIYVQQIFEHIEEKLMVGYDKFSNP